LEQVEPDEAFTLRFVEIDAAAVAVVRIDDVKAKAEANRGNERHEAEFMNIHFCRIYRN
jgi:hypothetical protein